MQLKTLKQTNLKKDDDRILIYLLNKCNGENKIYQTNILGRSMSEWVKEAIKDFPYIEFEYDGSDLINFLKANLVDCKYIVVLTSSLPLITRSDILMVLEYVKFKRINACKFKGGYAFNVEYLTNNKTIFFDSELNANMENFIVVESDEAIKYATSVLQDRIINEHALNGVKITNSLIEANVTIEKNTVIFSGNIVKGNTHIGENVILKENCVIENSVIGSDSCVSASHVINSKIEENVFVLPYAYIKNATIRKNAYIGSGMRIENRTVRAGSKIL